MSTDRAALPRLRVEVARDVATFRALRDDLAAFSTFLDGVAA